MFSKNRPMVFPLDSSMLPSTLCRSSWHMGAARHKPQASSRIPAARLTAVTAASVAALSQGRGSSSAAAASSVTRTVRISGSVKPRPRIRSHRGVMPLSFPPAKAHRRRRGFPQKMASSSAASPAARET